MSVGARMNKCNCTTENARGRGVLVDQEQKVDSPRRPHKFICKSHKLQKFATANSNFEKINYFRDASSYNVDVYQFSAKSG